MWSVHWMDVILLSGVLVSGTTSVQVLLLCRNQFLKKEGCRAWGQSHKFVTLCHMCIKPPSHSPFDPACPKPHWQLRWHLLDIHWVLSPHPPSMEVQKSEEVNMWLHGQPAPQCLDVETVPPTPSTYYTDDSDKEEQTNMHFSSICGNCASHFKHLLHWWLRQRGADKHTLFLCLRCSVNLWYFRQQATCTIWTILKSPSEHTKWSGRGSMCPAEYLNWWCITQWVQMGVPSFLLSALPAESISPMDKLCLAGDLLPTIFICTTNQFYTTIKELSRANLDSNVHVEHYLELLSQVEEDGVAMENAALHLAESIKTINAVSLSTLCCQWAQIELVLQRVAV